MADTGEDIKIKGSNEENLEDEEFSNTEYVSEHITCDEAIERMGVGPFQLFLLCVCGLAWMADALEISLLTFLKAAVVDDWGLNAYYESILDAVVFAGMLLGSWGWGVICDKFGRKIGIAAVFAFCSVFGLASAFAPNFWVLTVLRFFVGVGAGGGHAPFSLFTELLPSKSRGFFLLFIEVFWTIGTVVCAGFAWLFLGHKQIFGDYCWRYLVGVCSVPMFLMLIAVPFLPESPRFLTLKGKTEKAENVFKRVAFWNRKGKFLAKIKSEDTTSDGKKKVTGSFLQLFSSAKMTISTICIFILWWCGSLAYYGVYILTPKYFSTTVGNKQETDYGQILLVSAAELPGLLFAYAFINSFGRKRAISITFLTCGLFLVCLIIPTERWLLTIFAICARAGIMGATCALWVYTPETFPTSVRSLGTGISSCCARIAGMITPLIANVLIEVNINLPVLIYSGSCLLAFVLTHILPYETAGKSLGAEENSKVTIKPIEILKREQEEIESSPRERTKLIV
ncbi:hypothetical protein ABK040_007847 [Willaertia magna]